MLFDLCRVRNTQVQHPGWLSELLQLVQCSHVISIFVSLHVFIAVMASFWPVHSLHRSESILRPSLSLKIVQPSDELGFQTDAAASKFDQ